MLTPFVHISGYACDHVCTAFRINTEDEIAYCVSLFEYSVVSAPEKCARGVAIITPCIRAKMRTGEGKTFIRYSCAK